VALTTEVQAWLDELKKAGEVSDEDYKSLATAFERPKVGEFIKGSVLRQADYSRHMADLQRTKTELADKERQITDYQAQLGSWKSGVQEEYNKTLKEAEKLRTRVAAAQNRVRTLATTHGISEDEIKDILEGETVNPAAGTPPGTAPAAGPDTSQFLRRDEAHALAMLDASIHDLNVEHQRLFGTALPSATTLVQEALAAKKTLTEYWADKFKVAERRVTIQEEEINKRIETARQEERTKILSEQGLPGANLRPDLQGNRSPVFRSEGFRAPSADHQPGGGVSAAVAAFAAGKYRQPTPGQQ
jgi:hypothetical protein